MAELRRCADPRSRWSVATVKRKLSARQLLDIGHVIQRERRQPRPGMSTVPSIQGGAVRGPSPLVALGSDHVQELGRGGGHPRPAQPVGEHILEDPAWVAKPPGHPPGGRIDPQQDAASGCWAALPGDRPTGAVPTGRRRAVVDGEYPGRLPRRKPMTNEALQVGSMPRPATARLSPGLPNRGGTPGRSQGRNGRKAGGVPSDEDGITCR